MIRLDRIEQFRTDNSVQIKQLDIKANIGVLKYGNIREYESILKYTRDHTHREKIKLK